MIDWVLKTPVALIIFNRPETTAKVFEAIRRARPPLLFVAADGPRPDRPDDAEKCAAARAIIEKVDWPCEVLTRFSDTNQGCGLGEAAGFGWVFDHVPEAIFLEDDCLPHPSFFRFCQELLERYRDDQRVMHISGANLLLGRAVQSDSYHYSRYPFCWGWASWRRAWRHYDLKIKCLPQVIEAGWLKQILGEGQALRYWIENFQSVHNLDQPHTWDYQWILACWIQDGLSIIPGVNLVTNIGFGDEATHTRTLDAMISEALNRNPVLRNLSPVYRGLSNLRLIRLFLSRIVGSRFSNLPLEEMRFPLKHPPFMVRNVEADEVLQKNNYQGGPLGGIKRSLKKMLLRISEPPEAAR